MQKLAALYLTRDTTGLSSVEQVVESVVHCTREDGLLCLEGMGSKRYLLQKSQQMMMQSYFQARYLDARASEVEQSIPCNLS